ncbi:carboxylate--amine ligase [Intestinimonas butyriciproducens]|uniref:carboxylate--amine ligase n=1 Tax=Intestinimonas butyriciproducens TaxID=1297617 RepID=UPI00195BC542|nr:carboxylate--amine ligase [Intestinimonas butyriciproducens]MBM6974264.1 carboxylate--amine ligase [Intestinimonas butyriciproducens]
MKYLLYRPPGNVETDAMKHELVAVEFGRNLHEATAALIRAVIEDLSSISEYKGYKITAQVLGTPISRRKVNHYDYNMLGIIYPTYAKQNILIDYGVVEKEE